MYFFKSTFLLALLPSIVAADWLDKAKEYLPNHVPTPPNPIAAGAAIIADSKVEKINERNFQRKLGPKHDTEEEWIIYLTGGNKTCFGYCDPVDQKWNESVPLLLALPKVPNSNLRLGHLNCEIEQVLCTAMAATVPAVYHFIFPQMLSTGSQPLSPMREITVNISSVDVSTFTSIPRGSESRYLKYPEYTGVLHPIDGLATKFQLLMPFGWVLWGIGAMPSWLPMIIISFVSRQYMANRAGRRVDAANAAATAAKNAAAAAAPAGGAGTKKRN